MEYLKLKRLHKLCCIYKELKDDLFIILKLCRLVKRERIRIKDLERFVHSLNIGTYKIPQIQTQYQKLQREVQYMERRKQELEKECPAIYRQRIELTNTLNTLQQSFNLSAEKVSNLYKEKYWLEQSIARHKEKEKNIYYRHY